MSQVEKTLRRMLMARAKERAFNSWLSRKTGMSQAMLSRLINGTRHMGIRSCETIAKALGYKITLVPRAKSREK